MREIEIGKDLPSLGKHIPVRCRRTCHSCAALAWFREHWRVNNIYDDFSTGYDISYVTCGMVSVSDEQAYSHYTMISRTSKGTTRNSSIIIERPASIYAHNTVADFQPLFQLFCSVMLASCHASLNLCIRVSIVAMLLW